MKTSPHQGSRRRWSGRRYIRVGGWIVFWLCLGLTTVLSTSSDRLVTMPLIIGVVAVALTQGASWLMRRLKYGRSGHGKPRSPGTARVEHVPSAAAGVAAGRDEYALAREELARRRSELGTHESRKIRAPRSGGMKRPLKVAAYALITLAVVMLGALWLAFEQQPRVLHRADLSMDSYEKVQKLIEEHDPRTSGAGGIRTIVATQEEVNLIVSYAAKRFRDAAVRVALQSGAALVQASVAVPSSPFGQWLNFDAVLRQTNGLPRFEKLTIGSLPVPAFLADFGLEQIMKRFNATEQGNIAREMVKSVTLSQSQVKLVYEWRDDLVNRARASLISKDDQARFRAYSDRLFETLERSGRSQSVALSKLLPPMFALAKQRSAGGDAARENRAAIITLAFFAFGRDLSAIIPTAASWQAPVPIEVTLYGRDDSAQHFLVSAALAIEGGGALTNAIGIYREVDDSRRTGKGKGFSFQDLAADLAGTRFGTLASTSAQTLQSAITPGLKEGDFMPPFSDLAEEIPEAEFQKRYGGVGSPRYKNIVADIEARVARTPLLR